MRSYLLHYGAPLLGLVLLLPATASADPYSARGYYAGGWDAQVAPRAYRTRHDWGRVIYYAPPVHYGYRPPYHRNYRGHYRGHYRGNFRSDYRWHQPRHIAPRPHSWHAYGARHDLIYQQPYGRRHHLPRSSVDVTVRYRIQH